jgi:hypothetical protein
MYHGSDLPANNHDLVFGIGNRAFDDGVTLTTFNVCLRTTDVHGTITLKDVEFLKRIQSRRVLDVTGTDVEAC